MLPFLAKYWKILGGTLLVVILLGGAYWMGYDKAQTLGEKRVAELLEASQADYAARIAEVRGRELALSQKVAEADRQGAKNVEQIRAQMQSTIDDLSSGNRQLRKRLAAVEIPTGTGPTTPSPGLGGTGSVETVGLRIDDAQFLVRRADESDVRAEALKTCVNYYNSARESVQNLTYPVPNK